MKLQINLNEGGQWSTLYIGSYLLRIWFGYPLPIEFEIVIRWHTLQIWVRRGLQWATHFLSR